MESPWLKITQLNKLCHCLWFARFCLYVCRVRVFILKNGYVPFIMCLCEFVFVSV